MLKRLSHFHKLLLMVLILSLCACIKNKEDGIGVFNYGEQTVDESDLFLDLPDIEMGGELIVLTLYGPASYFEFRGADFGNQFLLIEEYAHSIGVRVRVDLSRSQDELVGKLLKGEGDIIAYNLNADQYGADHQLTLCGSDIITSFIDTLAKTTNDASLKSSGKMAWAVRHDSPLLAKSVGKWLEDNEYQLLSLSMPKLESSGGRRSVPRRKVSSPMLDPARGIISHYDVLLRRYANQCGWDWRLLAAQAYQESAFDPLMSSTPSAIFVVPPNSSYGSTPITLTSTILANASTSFWRPTMPAAGMWMTRANWPKNTAKTPMYGLAMWMIMCSTCVLPSTTTTLWSTMVISMVTKPTITS